MFTKLNQRTQSESDLAGVGKRSIGDVDGILSVGKVETLFQYDIVQLIAPNWQAHVEAEFAEDRRV